MHPSVIFKTYLKNLICCNSRFLTALCELYVMLHYRMIYVDTCLIFVKFDPLHFDDFTD